MENHYSLSSCDSEGNYEEEVEVCDINEEQPEIADDEEEGKTQNNSGKTKTNAELTMDKEVATRSEEISRPVAGSAVDEDDIHYLSGKKPFFDVILSASHLAPCYQLYLPTWITSLLPRAMVPAVLRHGGKNWDLSYNGNQVAPRLARWKEFAEDNHLKLEDACVFELLENSDLVLRFKVIILRNDDLPPELKADIESLGKTPESAIYIL